ncbi:MAG: ATP-binding cassette domain-containing protein [Chloroflexi bacterium]|nr:ATP-binding cassette domain-containing protein [Chloroflexota bacterium]
MAVLSGGNLSKYYGADQIFSGVSFTVNRGDKIALVGTNGAGKSTLLKIIAGDEESTQGQLGMARGTRVSYLAQEAQFSGERTLLEEAQQAFAHLHAMEAEIRQLEILIAETEHPDWEDRMERYGDLMARFEHGGGYDTERMIERTLEGLSFTKAQYHQRIGEFSGGQKTRAALAITLLEDPDLLLLDEPTNHLDLHALQWLEEFLRTWPGTLIVISHDRYFLDKVTTRTFEMAWGKLTDWPGNYSKFLQLKAERDERMQKDFDAQQAFIAKEEEFIRKHIAGQRTKEAQGRRKRLERLKNGYQGAGGQWIDTRIEAPKNQKQVKLGLSTEQRSGLIVLTTSDGLTVGYKTPQGDKPLVRTPTLELQRGQCVALMGANGSGKTTLLRTIVGELPILSGRVNFGVGVSVGYYAQTHDELNLDNTVLEEVHRVKPLLKTERIRTLLGRFLFSNDDVFKRVGDLSGGERSRVALAQLTLKEPNLLILDEPTNHLDIASREALESVLQEFPGTIMFVSHDRYFIDALADTIWMVEDGTVNTFEGDYTDYAAYVTQLELERKKAVDPKADATTPKAQPAQKAVPERQSSNAQPAAGLSGREHREVERQQREKQKQVNAVERKVADLERQLHVLQSAIETATAQRKIDEITRLGEEYVALEQQLQSQYDLWAELAG